MGAINFAGLRRMLDYQVTFIIQHYTISIIMSMFFKGRSVSAMASLQEINDAWIIVSSSVCESSL